jgi:hypothetical protein
MILAAAVLASSAFLDAAPPVHFDISAGYTRRRNGAGEVAVRFVAKDPDVKINERPAPKLKLEEGPLVVAPPPAARAAAAKEGEPPAYLDLTLPVTFPVSVAPGLGAGSHDAKGTVTYFYCSKREHWCRRGVTEVAFPVTVP